MMVKIREGVNESQSDLIAYVDDDGVYPSSWLETLKAEFKNEKVGFAGGPCVPLIDEHSSKTEKAIATATSSFFGTTSMSYRAKVEGTVRDADETNLLGNGLYRRDVYAKILNEEWDRIPPAAQETYILTSMRMKGYKTLFVPKAIFYHRPRSSLSRFSKQIFRSGMGRMVFFKQFPRQLLRKVYITFPMIFVLYLLTLPLWGFTPLLLYVAVNLACSLASSSRNWRLPLVYLVMHLSYGLGMLYGIFKNERTWS